MELKIGIDIKYYTYSFKCMDWVGKVSNTYYKEIRFML